MNLSQVIAKPFHGIHTKIKNEEVSEIWLKGGRGSTKSTFASIEILIGIMKDPEANAVIFRRYQNELRETVFGQFEWSATKLGVEDYFKFQVSPMQIIYTPTGQKIVFKAADNPKKIKSINLGKGHIKYAWFEEIDQFASFDEIRNILQSLFRGEDKKRQSFFTFNPPKSARSWVNKEVKIAKDNRIVHHSDYTEVPKEWLGESFIVEAEHLRKVNRTAYDHEYLGLEVGTGLEVFNNVTIRKITDEEIQSFDKIYQGLDFGYAVDPLEFGRMYFDKTRRRLYIFDEISGINLFNREFYEKAKAFAKNGTVADNAEPKSIAELKELGMNIVGSRKGAGSIEHGIKFLQELEEIIIDPEKAPRAASEFVNYALEVDRNNEVKSRFPDKDNHSIDMTRYALQDVMGSKKKMKPTIRI